jgi:ribosomal subunit interface protein
MSVQGRHLEVTPALEEYVRTRLTKAVIHFEGGVKEVNVRLSAGGGDRGTGAPRQRAEITVYTLRNGVVRAEDEEDSLYAAIDLVSDKVKQRLRKMKEKAISRGKWQGSGGPKGAQVISELVDWEDSEYGWKMDRKVQLPDDIVRTKTFMLQPATLEEATEQLEQVGHDFYLFQDKESGEIRVVYKRNHGGLGLIVPQLNNK